MKKVIILAVLLALAPFGCKTHKVIQSSQNEEKVAHFDSSATQIKQVEQTSQKDTSHVQREAKTVETYKETNITILADDNKDISVPGVMHLDSSSSLDSLKYSNDKNPKTSLNIYKPTPTAKRSIAELTTPGGKQTFKNWKSITISSKDYKKTTTGKVDSAASSLVTKILKNSIDSGHKSVDSTSKVVINKVVQKDSKTSFWSLIAGFWWIPVTLGLVLLIWWKWPGIVNLLKRK